jgi:MarR family transcriptional regulator, transcriptional regulator for hemolysin
MATTPAVDLMFLLHQAGYVLETEMTAGLAQIGITPREQCVLSTALRGDYSQIRLAELCALDKTTMVVTMDKLEAAGLAERRPSPTDRRTRIVTVTPKGEQVVADARAIVDRTYESVLSALEPDERDGFVDGLAKLVAGRLAEPAQCEKPPRRR